MAAPLNRSDTLVNPIPQQKNFKYLNLLDRIPQISRNDADNNKTQKGKIERRHREHNRQKLRIFTELSLSTQCKSLPTGLMHRQNNVPRLFDHVSTPIITAITSSVSGMVHTPMDAETTTAARKYYQQIVNSDYDSFHQKKQKIYSDLVVGTKSELNMSTQELSNCDEFELKYKIGLNNEAIRTAQGSVLTVGRYQENDIQTGDDDESISRLQCFILLIGDSLIILDGWSFVGTKTVQVNHNKKNLRDSVPDQRFVLRFNKNDTIHLALGAFNMDLIINPKECVVCMDNARVIRNMCGHLILCNGCYTKILFSSNPQCPLCRSPLQNQLDQQHSIMTGCESYRPPLH